MPRPRVACFCSNWTRALPFFRRIANFVAVGNVCQFLQMHRRFSKQLGPSSSLNSSAAGSSRLAGLVPASAFFSALAPVEAAWLVAAPSLEFLSEQTSPEGIEFELDQQLFQAGLRSGGWRFSVSRSTLHGTSQWMVASCSWTRPPGRGISGGFHSGARTVRKHAPAPPPWSRTVKST